MPLAVASVTHGHAAGWERWRTVAVAARLCGGEDRGEFGPVPQIGRPIAVTAVSGSWSPGFTTIIGWKPSRRSWRARRRS